MSPISGLVIQRRAVETGRIRIGQQIVSSNGKSRPSKLDAFRFTTGSERVARAIAEHLGGEPRIWQGAPVGEQWEILTPAKEIQVAIPPGDNAVSQWLELWTKGGCARRCDGERETLKDIPCPCAQEYPNQRMRNEASKVGRACKPTTRISVIIPDLPGIGVFRLETHGYNAAAELAGAAELLAAARGKGVIVPAVLRLEQRQSKTEGSTHNFAVPVLEVINTLRDLTALQSGAQGLAAALPPPPGRPALGASTAAVTAAGPRPVRVQGDDAPADAQAAAAMALAATDLGRLGQVGRYAREQKWLDVHVERDGAWESLLEVLRHRDAELRNPQPTAQPEPQDRYEREYDPTLTEPRDAPEVPQDYDADAAWGQP